MIAPTQHAFARARQSLRSVVVVVERSPSAEHVVNRALLLPLARDAQLLFLHVMPRLMGAPREADAPEALAAATSNVSELRSSAMHIRSASIGRSVAREIIDHARSIEAELVVIAPRRASVFRNLTTWRVVRRGGFPVLVVRGPARAYRGPLVALDLEPTGSEALAFARRLLPTPRPPMTAVHASDFHPLQATRRLAQLLASDLDDERWTRHVEYGDPRVIVAATAERIGADLLVLGTRGRSGLTGALLGSVAGDVLRDANCDVLVVPARRPNGTT